VELLLEESSVEEDVSSSLQAVAKSMHTASKTDNVVIKNFLSINDVFEFISHPIIYLQKCFKIINYFA
jgi:hypothetical protein